VDVSLYFGCLVTGVLWEATLSRRRRNIPGSVRSRGGGTGHRPCCVSGLGRGVGQGGSPDMARVQVDATRLADGRRPDRDERDLVRLVVADLRCALGRAPSCPEG
jgi:hypothetical protein